MKSKKILFIGGGNMTRAIVSGLIADGHHPDAICVVDRNEHKRDFFENTFHTNTDQTIDAFLSLADVVILSVKPQVAHDVCQLLHGKMRDKLIISVMAGITMEKLETWMGNGLSIIRTMPNTPALIQEGATGLFANPNATASEKSIAETLMNSIGITAWLTQENQLNAIIALSGSGPAYYFYFIEIMQDIAKKQGLPADIAEKFAIQTAYGAAKLALESPDNVQQLRQQVTSKNGTTDAAIKSMEKSELYSLLEKAMLSAENRALELSAN